MSNFLDGIISHSETPDGSQQNNFPIDVLPEAVKALAISAKENLGFPYDYTGAAILSAAGVAIGQTHEIQVKNTWTEKPILFVAIVGRAGEFKTHSINLAYLPVREWDKRNYAIYEAQQTEYKKNLQEYKLKADKQGEQEPEKPILRRRTVADHTIEALYSAVRDNGAIGVVQDELKGWFGNFGRYNKGSESEFWLSAFSGQDVNVIRKTTEPLFIQSPYLSVIGGTQIGILSELGKDGRDKSGFTDRMLFAFPDEIPQNEWRETDVPGDVLQVYKNIIHRLFELPVNRGDAGDVIPAYLHMSIEAKALWKDWFNRNAAMKHEADSDTISGIYTKLETYTLRFALILQMLRYASNEGNNTQISGQSMEGAIKLSEYFRKTAIRAAAAISQTDPLGAEPQDVQEFYSLLPDTFLTSEALQIAQNNNMGTRRIEKLLNKDKLFKKVSHGKYEKIIKQPL